MYLALRVLNRHIDKAGIQFQMLNHSKGAAVWVSDENHNLPVLCSCVAHRDPGPK